MSFASIGRQWRLEFLILEQYQEFDPPIHLSEEDFAVITENGSLLDDHGQVAPARHLPFKSRYVCRTKKTGQLSSHFVDKFNKVDTVLPNDSSS